MEVFTMEKLTDGVKKIFLAGIGAVATTAEKSQELLDDLVKKGELTVEQGKALNEELKHNLKEKITKSPEEKADSIVAKLSEEEKEALKAKLNEVETDESAEAKDE
jgi:polyhydroxyalkanoate synthesis regulator phasin